MEGKLLTPLRDIALPPSEVDLPRAVRDGRRRVRRRRIAAVATAGLAVAAVLAAAPAVLGRPDRSAPVLPAVPSLTSAPVAPMPDRAPAAFDAARQYADLGWLPAGLTERTVTTGVNQLAVSATAPPGPAAKDAGLAVELRLVPAGYEIAAERTGEFAVRAGRVSTYGLTPAEPVNGRTASWNGVVDPGGVALRWQYAPDAWAEVIVRNAPEDDSRILARRIAAGVHYGVDRPVRLPVRFAALPAGLKAMAYQMAAHDKATLRKLGGNLDGLFRDATLYPKVKDWR